MTYHTNDVPFILTIKTTWEHLSGYCRFFYIFDGSGDLTVEEARIDLLEPVKTTTKTITPQDSRYYSYTENTYEFNIALPNLSEGSHSLIWGFSPFAYVLKQKTGLIR